MMVSMSVFRRVGVVSEREVLEALRGVVDPRLGRDVVSLRLVRDLSVSEDGVVSLVLDFKSPSYPGKDELLEKVKDALSKVPGVKGVEVKVASQRPRLPAPFMRKPIKGVRNVFAVASGKGGVGKSTVAVNLTLALARMGNSVGLLDADIYGPTIPKMLEVLEQPTAIGEDRIRPAESYLGVKVMSLGLMVPEETPVIWRGPLVAKAISQMLSDVEWGELEYLVVDLPPGTGDASLTLAQTIPLTGVVIVTTPQDAALRIAVKALNMFRKMSVSVLGVIENMSYFICPHCGKRTDIFGHGGAVEACKRLGVDFLGEIPLTPEIRAYGDSGKPVVFAKPDSLSAKAFMEIASKIVEKIRVLNEGGRS